MKSLLGAALRLSAPSLTAAMLKTESGKFLGRRMKVSSRPASHGRIGIYIPG
jgi:hypothetical protein